MGLFDKLGDIINVAGKVAGNVENIMEVTSKVISADNSNRVSSPQSPVNTEEIILAASSRTVQDTSFGDNDREYIISFKLNDSFKETESHAGEVEMLNAYAPGAEYGEEGTYPYVAIQLDDKVYTAVAEFKEKGTFTGAMELSPLTGKFYFKAKMEYFGYIMYFYGLDRCDGFWKNNGLCMVYPKSYAGTANESKLMNVLDEAAQSYSEEQK